MTSAEHGETAEDHPQLKAAMRLAALLGHAPNALTAARPLIGAASGLEVLTDNAAAGAWLYLMGYGSDVADGFLSRALRAESDFGAEFDRWADVAFHAAVGLGLAVAAIRHRSWASSSFSVRSWSANASPAGGSSRTACLGGLLAAHTGSRCSDCWSR